MSAAAASAFALSSFDCALSAFWSAFAFASAAACRSASDLEASDLAVSYALPALSAASCALSYAVCALSAFSCAVSAFSVASVLAV